MFNYLMFLVCALTTAMCFFVARATFIAYYVEQPGGDIKIWVAFAISAVLAFLTSGATLDFLVRCICRTWYNEKREVIGHGEG